MTKYHYHPTPCLVHFHSPFLLSLSTRASSTLVVLYTARVVNDIACTYHNLLVSLFSNRRCSHDHVLTISVHLDHPPGPPLGHQLAPTQMTQITLKFELRQPATSRSESFQYPSLKTGCKDQIRKAEIEADKTEHEMKRVEYILAVCLC